MQKILVIAAIAAMSTAMPQLAMAQSSPPSGSTSIRLQVKQNLEQAGFTDIRVMPESFLVRAKDRTGNPVMMIINPDSFTAVTAIPEQRGDVNSAEQEGQTTSKSAKMTDNQRNSSSQQEGNQTTSESSKMSVAGQSQDIEGEKIPGRANGMTSELKQDESGTLKLSAEQRAAIWKQLGGRATSAGMPNRTLIIGETVPDTMKLQSMPGKVTNRVPAVKPYQYAMVHGQLLIVNPSTKKIAAILTE